MAQVIHFPLSVGRQDRVDPKLAPLGVLGVCSNLRVRKDGRLASRTGYQPVAMTTPSAALFAYDLAELNGRLIALGTSTSDGYPTDIWEYLGGAVGQSGGAWRQGDPASPRTPVGPFTNMRQLGGVPHPEGGTGGVLDATAGAGYVCLLYKTANGTAVNTLVVRQSDDQTILFQRGGNGGLNPSFIDARVIFAGGKFFLLGATSGNAVSILQYTPGVSNDWTAFATVDGANAAAVTGMDIVPVGNPTTALVAAVFARGTVPTIQIKVYTSAGAQLGSTITVASSVSQAYLEADQTANQIVLLTAAGGAMALRTFNFATTLLAGPTAIASTSSGSLVRVRWSNFGTPIMVAANISGGSNGVIHNSYNPATHAVNFTFTVQGAFLRTRLLDSSSPGQSTIETVSWGGLIAPRIAANDFTDATNALFTLSRSGGFQHVRRDYLNAKLLPGNAGLSFDATTGKVLWTACVDDGSEQSMPSLALLDFKSTARRQVSKFGSLLYLSGGTPLVYDSRIAVEPGFDLPGIISITPSAAAGSLTPGATYTYQVHFEFTLADGSLIQGPPSQLFSVTMAAGQNTNTLVVQTPHSLPVSLGGAVYGADVTAVVSRNVWNPVTGTPFSVQRRAKTQPVLTGSANYGATLSIIDTAADTFVAQQGAIYTQAERGALSGPLEDNVPQAHSFTVATETRLFNAGLLRSYETQISKEGISGQVMPFSEFSTFFNQVAGQIIGVAFLDGAKLVFTRDEIYASEGDGPDDIGGGGLSAPREIPTPGGLKSWQSFLKVPDGLFYQIDDTKLFLLPRGADSPSWVGKDVEDTLLAFPDMAGTCRNKKDNASCFAVQNAGKTAAQIVVRDMRTGLWTTDSPPLQAVSGIAALTNYGATMAYASNGVVYVQSESSFADNTSTVIPTQWKTNPLYPFQLCGYGVMNDIMVNAEFRSAGTLALRVSYDDGVSFVAYDSFVISGLTVGATVERKWALQQSDITSIIFEWTFTPSAPGEGLILLAGALMVQPVTGQLKELDPAEQA